MGVVNRIRRRSQMMLLACAAVGLAVAALAATPFVGAQRTSTGGFETLRALQTERTSFSRSISHSVVAIAANKPNISNPQQTGMAGSGALAASGFVVDGDYVVTSIESAPLAGRGGELEIGANVWMMSWDGTEFKGKVVGRDMRNLLLLIEMEEGHPKLPSLKLGDSDKAAMGSAVFSFGNTLDSLLIDRQISVSYGTVSGFYRFEPIDVMAPDDINTGGDPYKGNVLEVDVAVHQGDHGGPIVNLDGEVIGMLCQHWMAGRHLGCAVPSNQIRAVLAQLKKSVPQDELAQGYLGFKAKKPAGTRTEIFISDVDAGGPADVAGIKVGMQLVRVDNYRIPNWDRLREMLGIGHITRARQGGGMFARRVDVPVSYGVPVGTHMQLTLRDPDSGTEITVDLIVGEKEEDF